ncbi:unnamed protein product [Rhizophagus irregularis]|nr:unnamed protein product [Rhizophagus irregularis]
MRKEWHIWMCQGSTSETEAGNLKRAGISDVYAAGLNTDLKMIWFMKKLTEFEDKNLDELNNSTKIVDN